MHFHKLLFSKPLLTSGILVSGIQATGSSRHWAINTPLAGERTVSIHSFYAELKSVLLSLESLSEHTDLLHPICNGTEYQKMASKLHSLKDLMLLVYI